MINVILATDAKGLRPNATLVNSILATTDQPVHVRIFSREVSEEDFTLGRLRVEVIVTPEHLRLEGRVPPHVSAGPTFDRIAALAHCTDWARALIMDYDQVVVADIAEIFEMDLTDAVGAARIWHQNLGTAASEWFGRALPEHWKYCNEYHHFYMGPLVNLEEFRNDGVYERFLEFHKVANMEEQIAITVAARNRWLPLHASYNLIPMWDGVPADAKVLHFTGTSKPWNQPNIVGAHLWRHYETDWASLTGGLWCPKAISKPVHRIWERWSILPQVLQVGGLVFDRPIETIVDRLTRHEGNGTWLLRALNDEEATNHLAGKAAEFVAERRLTGKLRIMDGEPLEMLAWLNTEDKSWDKFDFLLYYPDFQESKTLAELCSMWTLIKPGGWLAVLPSQHAKRSANYPGTWKALDTWRNAFADQIQTFEDETTMLWFQRGGTAAAKRDA